MAEEFVRAVDEGLGLSKRIYFGKDRAVAPPKAMTVMEKSEGKYLPSSPMVYAVIGDPSIVDNPDIPSYQPYVYGRCDPPALIPLQMNGVALEVDCYLDTAFVTLTGSWRVHCVMGSRSCDCRIAIPMGEQGSILGLEVDVPRRSYCSQLVDMDDKDTDRLAKAEDGGFLKPHIFTLTIPQVDGGSNLSIKVRWSQKLLYEGGQFTLNIPFSFPEYVTPSGKKISKKEKIQLNVNSGPGIEVLHKITSHPLKELQSEAGKLRFLHESEVLTWSSSDFIFRYTVSSTQIFGGLLLQSPSVLDIDRRELFCVYLFPGNKENHKVFKKEVVFVIDISGSMRGKPLEDTKDALSAALSMLDPEDSFSIIAFNDETYIFSSSLEMASKEAIEKATQWISMNFIAGGGTNMLLPLNQAIEMFSNKSSSLPSIILITDGTVEDERHIYDIMKSHLANEGSIHPRIHTFGVGSFCNHYFLRTLAMIGRGLHDAAYDTDSIEVRMERLFSRALSTIIASISIDGVDNLHGLEVYPSRIPDLLSESPLIVSGRYHGVFPNNVKARGILPDMSNFSLDLKIHYAKDIPLDKVLAQEHIELLTAQAWLSNDKELEEKISKMSIQYSIVSEYTRMILLETEKGKKSSELAGVQKVPNKIDPQITEPKPPKLTILRNLGLGFGNITATVENFPPGSDALKPPEAAEILAKAATNCCGKLCEWCCCMCCISVCSRMNDQCAVVLTQFFGAMACLGCFACCELCCSGQDG